MHFVYNFIKKKRGGEGRQHSVHSACAWKPLKPVVLPYSSISPFISVKLHKLPQELNMSPRIFLLPRIVLVQFRAPLSQHWSKLTWWSRRSEVRCQTEVPRICISRRYDQIEPAAYASCSHKWVSCLSFCNTNSPPVFLHFWFQELRRKARSLVLFQNVVYARRVFVHRAVM